MFIGYYCDICIHCLGLDTVVSTVVHTELFSFSIGLHSASTFSLRRSRLQVFMQAIRTCEFEKTDLPALSMNVQAVYKKLMKEPVSLKDLRDLQPQLVKGLEELLVYEGDVEGTYCQSFQVLLDICF